MRMRRIIAVAMAAAIVVGAVGCGEEEQPSRAAFVTQVEKVCGRAMREFFASARKARLDEQSRAEQQAFAVRTLRTAVERQNEAFGTITPPANLEDAYSDYRDSSAKELDLLIQRIEEQGIDSDAEAGDSAEARQRRAESRKRTKLARQLGLRRCR